MAELFAAAESTGGFENNWLASLGRLELDIPLRTARLNPAYVTRHAQADGRRTTTDATSAYDIATYLARYPEKVSYDEESPYAGLRAQYVFIEKLVQQKTELVNQLKSVLYRTHPALLTYAKRSTPRWILTLVSKYPTALRLSRARPATVAKIPFVTITRAETLIAAAKTSVASATDPATAFLVRSLARQIQHLDSEIQAQKRYLTEELDLPTEVALLKTYPGVGDYTAVGLLLQIGAVERFASSKKMAAFFGVQPAFKQSGDGLFAVRMSKQGASTMRALLFQVTLSAVRANPVIAPLYKRLTDEAGMAKMAAIGACMHKALRIFYGMLKNKRAFDPAIEERHRKRSKRKRPRLQSDRRRRYQRYDPTAPLSARASERRRQRQDSQGAVHAKHGMSPPATAAGGKRPKHQNGSSQKHPIIT